MIRLENGLAQFENLQDAVNWLLCKTTALQALMIANGITTLKELESTMAFIQAKSDQKDAAVKEMGIDNPELPKILDKIWGVD